MLDENRGRIAVHDVILAGTYVAADGPEHLEHRARANRLSRNTARCRQRAADQDPRSDRAAATDSRVRYRGRAACGRTTAAPARWAARAARVIADLGRPRPTRQPASPVSSASMCRCASRRSMIVAGTHHAAVQPASIVRPSGVTGDAGWLRLLSNARERAERNLPRVAVLGDDRDVRVVHLEAGLRREDGTLVDLGHGNAVCQHPLRVLVADSSQPRW